MAVDTLHLPERELHLGGFVECPTYSTYCAAWILLVGRLNDEPWEDWPAESLFAWHMEWHRVNACTLRVDVILVTKPEIPPWMPPFPVADFTPFSALWERQAVERF